MMNSRNMRFVYFGYDHMLPCVQRLLDEEHDLLGIFTFHCDNVFNFNRKTVELGQRLGIPVLFDRPEDAHIKQFIAAGCEVFIAAGFPAKIPVPAQPLEKGGAYAINIHPSLLPKGRGIMPSPTIIISEPNAAGITAHKLSEGFDEGDILIQQALPLGRDETVDIYSARVAQAGPNLLSPLMADLPKFWTEALPQNEKEASVFPAPTQHMRTFDWSAPIEDIYKIIRAFGSFGSICNINGDNYVVYEAYIEGCIPEKTPAKVVSKTSEKMVVAANNGHVHLTRFEKIAP